MSRTGSSGRGGSAVAVASFFFIAFFCIASLTHAAIIRGIVSDPDGRPVPAARIVISGAQPGVVSGLTDENGRFEILNVPAGRQSVRVAMSGFTVDAIVVDLRDDTPLPDLAIHLRVSAVSEAVVVSAAQVDLPLSQTAASITIVPREDIEGRQLRTVGDALRAVPGLSVAQNGMLGSLTSLFTRGGESDFTLVLIDGMRTNSFGGGVDLSQVPLVNAERIEIVRGPQSAVFGSDAIGGVVQIVSRRADGSHIDGSLEGGNFNAFRGRLAAAGERAGWFASAQAEHAQTDGYRGIAPATGERVTNDDGRIQHGGGMVGWRGASGAEVRGQAQLSFTERGFPGAFGSNPIGAYTSIDRVSRGNNNRRQFGGQWMQPWPRSGRVRQRTDVAIADFDSTFLSPFGTSESESRRGTFRTQTDVVLNSDFGLTGGVELLRERAASTFITGLVFEAIPVKRFVGGYFGEARYTPGSHLSMTAGVRLEHIQRDALAADPNAFSPRPAFAEENITSANPRVAISYLLQDVPESGLSTRVHASAGTGIRPPDAFEIAFTDNPGLKPERSRSIDAGVLQTFAGGRAAIDATTFFNNYDDLIVAVGRSFRDASRYRTDNISNARSRGLELSATIRPIAALDVRGSYTFLDTGILSVDRVAGQAPAPYHVGEALIRRPRHQGSLVLLYSVQRWTGFADASFRGAVRDLEPTFGASGGVFDAKGFAAFTVGGAVCMVRMLEIFGRIENVADRHYEEAFGFPAPGRTGIVGVRFAARR